MEKIGLNQKKDATIFFAVSFTISVFLYIFGIQLKILIEANFFIALMFILKITYDYLYHLRLEIGETGVKINGFLNKKTIPWSELVVKTRALSKDQQEFIFQHNKDTQTSLKISYINNHSFIGLVKKHCPQEHELYEMVQKYAKEKNIPL